MKAAALLALALAAPAAAQTQEEMAAQVGALYVHADAAMTAAWRDANAAMKTRDAADRSRDGGFGFAAALLASQRAWLGFRDTQCVLEGGVIAAGTLQAMVTTRCRIRLTNERTGQLRALVMAR